MILKCEEWLNYYERLFRGVIVANCLHFLEEAGNVYRKLEKKTGRHTDKADMASVTYDEDSESNLPCSTVYSERTLLLNCAH